MGDVGHEGRRDRVAVGVAVVGEDARSGDDLGRVAPGAVAVGDRDRCLVGDGGREAGHPGRAADGGAGDPVAGVVGQRGAAAGVQVPDAHEVGLGRRDLDVPGGVDLTQGPGDAPDPDLVDDAGEEAVSDARRVEGAADRRQDGRSRRWPDGSHRPRACRRGRRRDRGSRSSRHRWRRRGARRSGVTTVLAVIGWLRLGVAPPAPSSKSATSWPLLASMPRK